VGMKMSIDFSFWKKITENLDQGFLLVDKEGKIIYGNSLVKEILQLDPIIDLGNKKVNSVFHQARYMEAILENKGFFTTEKLTAGNYYIVRYIPFKNDQEELCCAILFDNINQHIELQRQNTTLKIMTEIYEAILDEVMIGLVIVDLNGQIMMMNQLYSELIGVDSSKVIGKPIAEIVEFSSLPKILATKDGYQGKIIAVNHHELVISEQALFSNTSIIGGVSKLVPIEQLRSKDLLNKFRLLESRLMFYQEELKTWWQQKSPFASIIGESDSIKQIKRLAERVAKGDASVMLMGESGTGKELFAHSIHHASLRSGEPFIKINCAAIPENLLESELFGYEEGAFTGAVKGGKPGKFELANRGTVFLDEIGDMPFSMQAKILRVLQDKTFERVGGHNTIYSDVRIIAATNQDLEKLVEEQKFRLDLYYRLSVIAIEVSPLRDRPNDIILIAQEIVNNFNRKYNLEITGIHQETKEIFLNYPWPGNVRQLENVLEYAFNVVEEEAKVIQAKDLPPMFMRRQNDDTLELETIVAKAEKDAIIRALQVTNGNKQEAAGLLGIHRSGFYQKLKRYNIES